MRNRWSVSTAILGFIFFFSLPLRAQQFAGVTGLVTDKTGSAVSGVEVTLDNDKVGLHVKTSTNDEGEYQFLRVAPGSGYKLTYTKQGFKRFELADVALGVSTTSSRNVVLELGEVTQIVEVKGEGETTLDTTDASIGLVFDTTKLQQLPIQGRNSPAALLSLQAGTTPFGNVTGARDDQDNITIDGIDANDQATGQAFATVGNASVDAIQEFRTTTSGDLAGGGRAAGGQIALVTKGGTNQFHGTLREYHRNNAFGANSFFNNRNTPRIPLARLVRNQFGGNISGPLKKDKLFFFFDYEGQRDASGTNTLRIVPLDHVRNGQLGYINSGNDAKGNPCDTNARLNDPNTAQCVTILSSAQLMALDPAGTGPNTALLNFVSSRYPHANDLTAGDGINSGGLRFNTPFHLSDNTYIARVDYNISNNQKLFGRFNVVREMNTDDDSINNGTGAAFPGDPVTNLITQRDYSFAIGHTWTISPTKVNQLTIGESRSVLNFPNLFHPTSPNTFNFGPYSTPFARIDVQSRTNPVYTYRDDFTYTHGKHTFLFGGTFRPISSPGFNLLDFNTVNYGLGGNLLQLDPSVRPADILNDPNLIAINAYDNAFPFTLGRTASVSTAVSYDRAGNPLPSATGAHRNDILNQMEFYAQDTWRLKNNFSLTYGLRWSYQNVPYEKNGFEASANTPTDSYYAARVAAGLAGISSNTSAPILTYSLAGRGNNAPGFYAPTLRDFSPRVGFAYNPSFKDGVLGHVLGDRRTTIRAGGAIVYDTTVTSGIAFTQDIFSFLFRNTLNSVFSNLATDPRFSAIGTLPATNTPVAIPRPFTPFVTASGLPVGTALNQFTYSVDPTFKTPYNYQVNFGVQRELPGGFFVEVDYAGRFAHKLVGAGDASQIADFKDNASGQFLIDAFNTISKELRADPTGGTLTDQPFFENQMNLGLQASFNNPNRTCANTFGISCTTLVAAQFGNLVTIGDLTDTLQGLYGTFRRRSGALLPLLTPNIGLASQFATNTQIGNKAASNYHALLVTVRKRLSRNLQFDVNYTYSHSIDNLTSSSATGFSTLICDIRDLHVCRGSSDFDLKHVVNANFIYDLPVGQSQTFGRNVPKWADYIIGGWQVSGIESWYTGLPFNSTTNAFPTGFFFNSPGLLTGTRADVAPGQHTDTVKDNIQYFSNRDKAIGAFTNPLGGQTGSRNNLRGPGFNNIDLAVSKSWKMPWSEGHKLQFRMEAYNAFNHANFSLPNAALNGNQFGVITSTANNPREIQFALRYDF